MRDAHTDETTKEIPMQCEIQWIDDAGNPTPDSNEAVARIRANAHPYNFVLLPQSREFACCAEHLKQMPDNWTVVEILVSP